MKDYWYSTTKQQNPSHIIFSDLWRETRSDENSRTFQQVSFLIHIVGQRQIQKLRDLRACFLHFSNGIERYQSVPHVLMQHGVTTPPARDQINLKHFLNPPDTGRISSVRMRREKQQLAPGVEARTGPNFHI